MFARLVLALLIALLSLPATAAQACHAEAPAAATAAMHHGGHHKPAPAAPALPDKLCLGCVAPATARAPSFTPPLAFAPPLARPAAASGTPRAAGPPRTPPPRSEA